jgi:hypothetical protein
MLLIGLKGLQHVTSSIDAFGDTSDCIYGSGDACVIKDDLDDAPASHELLVTDAFFYPKFIKHTRCIRSYLSCKVGYTCGGPQKNR